MIVEKIVNIKNIIMGIKNKIAKNFINNIISLPSKFIKLNVECFGSLMMIFSFAFSTYFLFYCFSIGSSIVFSFTLESSTVIK